MKSGQLITFLAACTVTAAVFAPLADGASKRFVVDRFDKSAVNELPAGWRGRGDDAKQFYKVAQGEGGNRYLRVQNQGTDQFIIKEAKVDLVRFPTLHWKWRAHSLPLGGNEGVKKACDSAGAINVIVRGSKWRPRTIKYTWSSTLKEGTATKSPYCKWPGQCDIIVVQSGDAQLGKWVSERRNVLEDYKRLYGDDDIAELEIDAILVMSDGDNTHSLSAADYDDIYFSNTL